MDLATARMRIPARMQILPQNLDRQARDFLLRLEEVAAMAGARAGAATTAAAAAAAGAEAGAEAGAGTGARARPAIGAIP